MKREGDTREKMINNWLIAILSFISFLVVLYLIFNPNSILRGNK